MSETLLSKRETLPLLVIDEATRAGGVLDGRTKLMKIVFLAQQLAQQILSSKSGPFALYKFEAYNFGPFSADVLADLDDLALRGLIKIQEVPLDTQGRVKEYRFSATQGGHAVITQLEKVSPQIGSVRKSIDPFIRMPRSEIVDYVYRSYPESVQ